MNARENPFSSALADALPFHFSPGDSWEALLSRLEVNGWRGSIVGSHGTGKTTLLKELAPRLAAYRHEPRLFAVRSHTGADDKRHLLAAIRTLAAPVFPLIDGAEQLNTREWLTLHAASAACAGCVITVHRASRLPVLLETKPTVALLNTLVDALCSAPLPEGEAEGLFFRHRGNLRECLRELHDRWAGE